MLISAQTKKLIEKFKIPFSLGPVNFILEDKNVSLKDESLSSKAPILKQWLRCGTGHPDGFVFIWMDSDKDYLYIRIDFTPDNTQDGDQDYTKILIKGKEFKCSTVDLEWGYPVFGYTDTVDYMHNAYNFKIPLSAFDGVLNEHLSIRFKAYGTAGPSGGAVTFENCFSTGVVTSPGVAGGFMGSGDPSITMNNCAWWTGAFTKPFGSYSKPVSPPLPSEYAHSSSSLHVGDEFYVRNNLLYDSFTESIQPIPTPNWGPAGGITLFRCMNFLPCYNALIAIVVSGIGSAGEISLRDEGLITTRCARIGAYSTIPEPVPVHRMSEVGGTDESNITNFYAMTHPVYAQGT